MSRRRDKRTGDTIHRYLTRNNPGLSEEEPTFSSQADSPAKPVQSKMAVSNEDLKKLLLGMEERMDKKLDDKFSNLNERIDKITATVESLEFDIANVKKVQQDDAKRFESLGNELEDLRNSLLHTQVHSRKSHLLLYGVDGYETSPTETIKRVREFAEKDLKLGTDFSQNVVIRNAHRLQKKDNGPTPIIMVFLLWEEREAFLKAGRNLAGTRMSVRTDLPPILKQKRGKLAHEAFLIRRDEKIQARVREKGIDVWLETRQSSSESWKRV